MNSLSLKVKLGVGFGALLLIMIGMGVNTYISIGKLSDAADDAIKQMGKTSLIDDAALGLEKQSNATRGYILTADEATLKRREEGAAQFKASWEKFGTMLQTPEGKKLYAEVTEETQKITDIQ